MPKGFVIKLSDGRFVSRSGTKYVGPITDDLVAARHFKTVAGADTTLKKLQRDGAYGRKFVGAGIASFTITLD